MLVPAEQIIVLPPVNPEESGFEGLLTEQAIGRQLLAIAHAKHNDVRQQSNCPSHATVIVADTTIVAGPPGQRITLGQPPTDATYASTMRAWFRDHYFGQWHLALTGLIVTQPNKLPFERVVSTRIRMIERDDELLEWYIATEEPHGKAGGYALQGAGSLFIAAVEGSLSNVVGLPLEALREGLTDSME